VVWASGGEATVGRDGDGADVGECFCILSHLGT
jgi:hypothetical protein